MESCRVGFRILIVVAAVLYFAPAGHASETGLTSGENKWPSSRIRLSISSSMESSPNLLGDVKQAYVASLMSWSKVSGLRFDVVSSDLLSVSRNGIRGDGISLITAAPTLDNSKLFPEQENSPAALTRVYSDGRGQITEVDIALNPFVRFSTDGAIDTYDLQETLTHEIGHLLGLEHSPVLGSIMHPRGSRTLGHSDFNSSRRALPALDVASVRSLYGPEENNFRCCGTVYGSLSGLSRKSKTLIWLEEISTGRLIAAGSPGADGRFLIRGVPEGEYGVFLWSHLITGGAAAAESRVSISAFESERIFLKLRTSSDAAVPEFLGTTFGLSRAAIRFSPTQPTILLGSSRQLDGIRRVGISGTDLWFDAGQPMPFNESRSVRVLQINMASASGLSAGEYTLVIEDIDGVRSYLPGVLLVP